MNDDKKVDRGLGQNQFITESMSLNLFWLRIMKEHSLFLRLGLPCDQRELIERAMFFEQAFDRLLERARRIQGGTVPVVRALNEESIQLVRELIEYKTRLLLMMLECRLGGFNYPLLIDHIRREAIYFVNHLERLQRGEMTNPVTNLLLEEVFWLRIMADHSKFIKHLLDPSERQLVETADDLSEELDELRFQAEDFESFLRINPIFVPSLGRFTNDAIGAIMNIRDFKAQARNLIARCEIISLIPELLADHVLREAEHSLELLRRLLR
jgi:ribosomal protein L29